MKRFFMGVLIGLLLSAPVHSIANDVISMIGKKVDGEINVNLDGEYLSKKAITIEGTSYLPLRVAAETLGFDVYYNAEKREVELTTQGDDTVTIEEPTIEDQELSQEQQYTLEFVENQITPLTLRLKVLRSALAYNPNDEEAKIQLVQVESELARWEEIKKELLNNK